MRTLKFILAIGMLIGAVTPSWAEGEKEKRPFGQMREYRTNYFIYGEPDTKIQLSFLFSLLKSNTLMLGYTQKMFWDLFSKDSSPFSDVNYWPELFYRFSFAQYWTLDAGFGHISNGEAAEKSRAINQVFARLSARDELSSLMPRFDVFLRAVFSKDEQNPDLKEYYGPFVLRIHFDRLGERFLRSEEFYAQYWNGGKWGQDFSKSSIRVSVRFNVFQTRRAPRLFFQYFNGYADSLLLYDERQEAYRAGIALGGW